MQGFEILPGDKVRIGREQYRLLRHDFRNGETSSVEASGMHSTAHPETLHIDQLKSVRPMDFPNGFSLDIYEPGIENCKRIDNLTVKHVFGRAVSHFDVSFIYSKWKGSSDLATFCRGLAAAFLTQLPQAFAVSVEDEEVGVRVYCKLQVPMQNDLHEFACDLGSRVSQILESNRATSPPPPVAAAPKVKELKPDEYGIKWWLRYVVIPIAASGTVVAIIGMLAKQA